MEVVESLRSYSDSEDIECRGFQVVDVAIYCALAAAAACSLFFFLHVLRISLNSECQKESRVLWLTSREPLFPVFLHCNMRIEMVQGAIGFLTSVPAAQIQTLNLVVSPPRSFLWCRTTQRYECQVCRLFMTLILVCVAHGIVPLSDRRVCWRSRPLVTIRHVAIGKVSPALINLIDQRFGGGQGDAIGVDMAVRG